MFYASCTLLLTLAMSKTVLGAKIESPDSLVTCQPIAVTYSDAPDGDVFISVIKGGDAASPALVDLGKHSGPAGQITWIVNLAAETGVTFKLVDKDGQITFSSPIDIQSGPDDTCIGKPASVTAIENKDDAPSSSSESETSSSASVDPSAATATTIDSTSTTALPSGESSSSSVEGAFTTTPSETTASVPFDAAGSSSSIAGQPGAGFASFKVSAGLATVMVGVLAVMALV